MRHPEYLADLTQIEIAALELESRSPRRDFQVRNLCERVEYFLGNAITEVGGVLVVAQIFERQHRDRFVGNCNRLALSRRSIDGAIATEKKQPDRHEHADNDYINPDVFLLSRRLRHRVGGFGAFNSLRRQLEHPRENKRNRQTKYDQQNNQ